MSDARRTGHRAIGLLATLAVGLTTAVVTHQSAVAAPAANVPTKHHGSALGEKQDYDARTGASATSKGAISRPAARSSSRPATQQLRSSLGDQAIVEMDGTTGTVRVVARLNGFLTAEQQEADPRSCIDSSRPPRRARPDPERPRDVQPAIATTSTSSACTTCPGPSGRRRRRSSATASRPRSPSDGRILSLGGSPVSGLCTPQRRAPSASPPRLPRSRMPAAERPSRLKAGPRDTAERVVFVGPGGQRAAWQVVTMSSQRPTLSVVDARPGRALPPQPA